MSAGKGRESDGLGPESPIPDKLYFKIGEVAQLVGVHAHVLRYWQNEVPAIRPVKSASNQRRYRHRDVEIFREVRRLLYQERYTLAGARKRIAAGGEPVALAPGDREPEALVADAVVAPDAVTPPVAAAPSAAPVADNVHVLGRGTDAHLVLLPPTDGELCETLRRGLKELIRLAGEEP